MLIYKEKIRKNCELIKVKTTEDMAMRNHAAGITVRKDGPRIVVRE